MTPTNDRQREALTKLLEERGEVSGRFVKLKRIGSGASGNFSALFSAEDKQTQQSVALKFLLPMYSGGYRDQSFEREAALLEHLGSQPDIIQLVAPRCDFTEVFRTDQGFELPLQFSYLAVELATTDFGELIANDKLDAEQLLIGFRSMCRGVQRLHGRAIVHRDLKPPNFLVMQDGTVRLSDLGTARLLDGTTIPLAVYGGPPGDVRYAPPEMLAGLHDERPTIAFSADFFALGAILFEMFAGAILGSRLYDVPFITDLGQVISSVKMGQRFWLFHELITAIADARPIPSVATFGGRAPNSIRSHIDDLVRRLAMLDYRRRLCDFGAVFNRIDLCLLILRNEHKYRRWSAEKRRRRQQIRISSPESVA